ncbi:MAG: exodeoxyribonuclease VII large subunit [Candidatus Poseidoniaceae archaeon]|nr:exodeoxyribonuclease VII large subunit [Candidatus Poseidoniaceae archaeon]MDG1559454.1 exodeoxyribonuclease VII large subunit [Candidatus Poseidoniaceae archaeon]
MTGRGEVTTGPLPVGQFVTMVKRALTSEPLFQRQAIKGEVSQWKSYASGHTYFTLRDNDGQMSAVIWKGRCAIHPSIKEGTEVVVTANVDVYVKRGNIQLIVERIEPVNALGAMEEAKRLLVERLRNEGELDRPRTRPPVIPKHIAIITGAGSAALADMQQLIENRWPGLRRTVIGVLVQGQRASEEIVRALALTRRLADPVVAAQRGEPPVDLVIVGRGGGSPEDLWAFNLEPVIRSIIASPVPVVSAVGHESDLLVSDLVADVRASTPSNAIERTVPVRAELEQWLDELDERLAHATRRTFGDARQRLIGLHARLKVAPLAGINMERRSMLSLQSRLNRATESKLANERTRLASIEASLHTIHPKRVLERGYAMTQTKDGTVVTNTKMLELGQEFSLHFVDGSAEAAVTQIHTMEEEQ